MPLLFPLGIHGALERVASQLGEGEHIFAYLDDVYAVAEQERIRELYDMLAVALGDGANIQLHTGKTRVWNRAGVEPPGVRELGSDVWSPQGVVVLGSPVGTNAFVADWATKRLEDEKRLWDALPNVPDLQCSWQLLRQCAGPRANHVLRTLPPSESAPYAAAHDAGMWEAAMGLLGSMPGSAAKRFGPCPCA